MKDSLLPGHRHLKPYKTPWPAKRYGTNPNHRYRHLQPILLPRTPYRDPPMHRLQPQEGRSQKSRVDLCQPTRSGRKHYMASTQFDRSGLCTSYLFPLSFRQRVCPARHSFLTCHCYYTFGVSITPRYSAYPAIGTPMATCPTPLVISRSTI